MPSPSSDDPRQAAPTAADLDAVAGWYRWVAEFEAAACWAELSATVRSHAFRPTRRLAARPSSRSSPPSPGRSLFAVDPDDEVDRGTWLHWVAG